MTETPTWIRRAASGLREPEAQRRMPLGDLPPELSQVSALIARCWHSRPTQRPEMVGVLEELRRCEDMCEEAGGAEGSA